MMMVDGQVVSATVGPACEVKSFPNSALMSATGATANSRTPVQLPISEKEMMQAPCRLSVHRRSPIATTSRHLKTNFRR